MSSLKMGPQNGVSDTQKGYTMSFKLSKNLAGQKPRGKNFGPLFLDVFSLPESRSGLGLAPKIHAGRLPNWWCLVVRNCKVLEQIFYMLRPARDLHKGAGMDWYFQANLTWTSQSSDSNSVVEAFQLAMGHLVHTHVLIISTTMQPGELEFILGCAPGPGSVLEAIALVNTPGSFYVPTTLPYHTLAKFITPALRELILGIVASANPWAGH
ncbi:uncharacterized protein EDB91DRAFT_1085276 [Suillus paluster]|uniref:uncharacterized protein n=1 Tax=Suillus paluster TaxID=48578 RepID=UPI001B867CCD|nr:uncharacterized protein EDB91DRAFT_1085276 [Suillus paluster]KAG1730801.1 hypothetical protein EDB91DRAFT_1085276 [Suillus paluster]